MNIAFPALLLFLLVLPGLLFRRGYLIPPLPATSITDEIAWAIIPALVLHSLATTLVESITTYRIDFSSLGQLLLGAQRDTVIAADFSEVGHYFHLIAWYNILLWIASFGLGWLFGKVVVYLQWDRKYAWLKRSDDWRDLIEGRLLIPNQQFDYVWLDALVNSGGETLIYSGIMSAFIYSADGKIEALVFTEALKWMSFGSAQIPGAAFAVKFSEILNLNVSFVQLPENSGTPMSTADA